MRRSDTSRMDAQMVDVGLVRAAADQLVSYDFRPWFYGDSVGAEGLMRASDLLGDEFYAGFVHGMARGALGRDGALRPYDNTVPGRALVELAVRRGDTRLLEGLGALLEALQQRRTIGGVPVSMDLAGLVEPYGGDDLPDHEAALLEDPGAAVYLDCLHFDPTFLCAYGKAVGDDVKVRQGVQLAASFVSLLQTGSGLFQHFFLERTQRAYVDGWSRGQGWALLGLLDVIEDAGSGVEGVDPLCQAVVRLAQAVRPHQRASGHWASVLGDQESPTETSAAAFYAAAFMRMCRLGLGDDELRDSAMRALSAVLDSTDEQGRLGGASAVVWSSTSAKHYNHVPLGHMVPWSQGPLLLAVWEAHLAGNEALGLGGARGAVENLPLGAGQGAVVARPPSAVPERDGGRQSR